MLTTTDTMCLSSFSLDEHWVAEAWAHVLGLPLQVRPLDRDDPDAPAEAIHITRPATETGPEQRWELTREGGGWVFMIERSAQRYRFFPSLEMALAAISALSREQKARANSYRWTTEWLVGTGGEFVPATAVAAHGHAA